MMMMMMMIFPPQVNDDIVNSVPHCLVSLKSPSNKKKKRHKVAFTELSPSEQLDIHSCESGECQSLSESSTVPVDVEGLYNGYLLDLVCNICSQCLDEISENNSLLHLQLLSCLVPHFSSTKLMKTLLDKTSEQSSICSMLDINDYPVLSEQFLHWTLFPWIKSFHERFVSNEETAHVSGVFTGSRTVDYLIVIFCGVIRTLPVVKQVELVSESLQVRYLHYR